MDRRFLRSKEFWIAAVLAAFAVAAGAYAALNVFPEIAGSSGGSCQLQAPAGNPVEANVHDTGAQPADGDVERTLTWTLDPSARTLSQVDACGNDGELVVTATDGAQLRVVAHLVGDREADVLQEDRPRVRVAESGERLHLAVDQPRNDTARDEHTNEGRDEGPHVRVEIQVPEDHRPNLTLRHDDGDLAVDDVAVPRLSLTLDDGRADLDALTAGQLRVDLDDGEVEGGRLDVRGNVDVQIDDGNVDLGVASITSGDWRLGGDDGALRLDLPAGEQFGYDAEIRVDDGTGLIELANSDVRSRTEEGRASARSTGFEDRPTQVWIDAQVDDGSVEILSR